jgi:hypothetical protein
MRPMPMGSETSTAVPSDSTVGKAYARAPVGRSDGSDLVPVRVNGLWGYAHARTSSQLAISPRFAHAKRFTEGVAAVAVAGKWGYIDPSGAFRIPAQFDAAEPFAGGVAKVTRRDTKEILYIDPRGAVVPAPSH